MDACIDAGITSFAINTHHLAEEWAKAFPDKNYRGYPIELFHEDSLLETGGGLKNIESFFEQQSVLVFNGDILSDLNLENLIQQHINSQATATLAVMNHGPNCNIAVENNSIVDLRHARNIHPGTHQFTGIYCVSPGILELIPSQEKVSVIPAFLTLAQMGKLSAYDASLAHWEDLGTRDIYLQVNQSLCSHTSGIHPLAKVSEDAEIDSYSTIGAHAIVPAGCKITKSVIWEKAVLSKNTKLDQCVVRHDASGEHSNVDF